MNSTITSILVATVLQFICGAIWYSALFGKLWGKIHGFDKLPKDVQEKMMKSMGPMYGVQLLVTVLTTYGLLAISSNLPNHNIFTLAGLLWICFIVPPQVSGVIFGGTESTWIVKKIAVQAGAALLCLEVAALVFYVM